MGNQGLRLEEEKKGGTNKGNSWGRLGLLLLKWGKDVNKKGNIRKPCRFGPAISAGVGEKRKVKEPHRIGPTSMHDKPCLVFPAAGMLAS